jgi:hypothetical protein
MRTETDTETQTHESLLRDGWERRSIVGPEQVDEMRWMHEQVGREVRFEPLAPTDLSPACGSCVSTVCGSYFVLYIRHKQEEAP